MDIQNINAVYEKKIFKIFKNTVYMKFTAKFVKNKKKK